MHPFSLTRILHSSHYLLPHTDPSFLTLATSPHTRPPFLTHTYFPHKHPPFLTQPSSSHRPFIPHTHLLPSHAPPIPHTHLLLSHVPSIPDTHLLPSHAPPSFTRISVPHSVRRSLTLCHWCLPPNLANAGPCSITARQQRPPGEAQTSIRRPAQCTMHARKWDHGTTQPDTGKWTRSRHKYDQLLRKELFRTHTDWNDSIEVNYCNYIWIEG